MKLSTFLKGLTILIILSLGVAVIAHTIINNIVW